MKRKKPKPLSRRSFLHNLGIAGASVVPAASVLSSCSSSETSGRKIKLMNQHHQLVEVDIDHLTMVTKEEEQAYLTEIGRQGIPQKKFVMVVDLGKCKNARKCMSACQEAHQLKPEQHHINVLQMTDEVSGANYFMPKPCQHCDNPPCVSVCPVGATFKRTDGIVLIDNHRCIGCRFCIAACPYSARTFNWTEPKDTEKYEGQEYNMELNVPQKLGTVTKCAFSADRLREGKLPYCVSACPNGVYYFGDAIEDLVTNGTTKETVRLSTLLDEHAAYTLMPDLGTKPSVYYLPAVKNES